MTPVPNTPEGRQAVLMQRACSGSAFSHAALAAEFGVSPDTIRRDLLALESQGVLKRVRGGALPVAPPAAPMLDRLDAGGLAADRVAAAALDMVADGMVLLLDGGTTVTRIARSLPPMPNALVVTPAPSVALATLARGIETLLIGGRLSARGGVAVGVTAVAALSDIAADLCFLGACGIDPEFGLSADDLDEAELKRAMCGASHRRVVVTGAAKLGMRARHRVAACTALDALVTDAAPEHTRSLAETGLEIRHA